MQFKLHINETNDPQKIAACLEKLVKELRADKAGLNHGWRREFPSGLFGSASMELYPEYYNTQGEAEATLKLKFEWKDVGDEWLGMLYGMPHAKVKKDMEN